MNNIFLNMFSLVNKIYTVEDFMLSTNIPKPIYDYFYISMGIELQGRFFNYEDEYISVYIIRDDNNHSFKDTILFDNKPVVVIVIPYIIDGVNTSEINTHRVNMIKNIYKYLFRFITRKLDAPTNSSLHKLLVAAPSVLTLFSEINTGQLFDIDDIVDENSGVTTKVLEKTVTFTVEDLFVNGGLVSLV